MATGTIGTPSRVDQDRGALAERHEAAVEATFALREDQHGAPAPQPRGGGLHRPDEIGVRVDGHEAERGRHAREEGRGEVPPARRR